MWMRVALDKDSVHIEQPLDYSYVEGPHEESYYFDEQVAKALEKDGFLLAMWKDFDALFDWGDCDFFLPDKCAGLRKWLVNRLQHPMNPTVEAVYRKMLDFSEKAVAHDTGISFDF